MRQWSRSRERRPGSLTRTHPLTPSPTSGPTSCAPNSTRITHPLPFDCRHRRAEAHRRHCRPDKPWSEHHHGRLAHLFRRGPMAGEPYPCLARRLRPWGLHSQPMLGGGRRSLAVAITYNDVVHSFTVDVTREHGACARRHGSGTQICLAVLSRTDSMISNVCWIQCYQ